MKEEIVRVTCDVCGRFIEGDWMTVQVGDDEFHICLPRTAPINKCGNQTQRAILNLFKKSDVAKALLKFLDFAD